MDKVKLYLKSYGADQESATTEVLNFLSSEIGDGYEITNTYSENDEEKVKASNKKLTDILNYFASFKEPHVVVNEVLDIKGLKSWCNVQLVLEDNNIDSTDEFNLLEHNFDIEFIKVVELNYTTDAETLFIFEVMIELDV